MLAIDPGVTTGWSLLRARDRAVLGMGDLSPEELGCALDLLIRTMHRLGYRVEVAVEDVPRVNGVRGSLAVELEFVNRTVDHWVSEVFELRVAYVLPGTWKTSRAAMTAVSPPEWNGKPTSRHMKDAYGLATYRLVETGVR